MDTCLADKNNDEGLDKPFSASLYPLSLNGLFIKNTEIRGNIFY